MGQIKLSGSLSGGPASGGGNTFPAAQFLAPIVTIEDPKGFQSASGVLTQIISSPASFVALSGLGTAQAVAAANFFYFKSSSAVQLRLTYDDGAGGTTIATLEVGGLFITEVNTSRLLQLAEVQGSATVEYLASGPQ